MKSAHIIFAAAAVLGAGGLGAMTLLPTSGAQAVVEPTSRTAVKTETFDIEKMTCAACPITIKNAINKVSGVVSVDVDFRLKTAKVTFDPKRTNAAAIAAASTNAGYPANRHNEGVVR